MSTLKVENLTKEYGDVTAVDDISFEIEDEFVVLLGESGAGKSTLLRCVNGLPAPLRARSGSTANRSKAPVRTSG